MNKCLTDATGVELIATAGAVAAALAATMDDAEITSFCELLGLVNHNLEIIKFRRYLLERAALERAAKENIKLL
jgi:hypothetical protein